MLRMHSGRQADLQRKPCHKPADAEVVTGQSRVAKDEAGSHADRYAPRKLGPFETVRATIGVLAICHHDFFAALGRGHIRAEMNHRSFDLGQTFNEATTSKGTGCGQ